jgi:hypothetical protein
MKDASLSGAPIEVGTGEDTIGRGALSLFLKQSLHFFCNDFHCLLVSGSVSLPQFGLEHIRFVAMPVLRHEIFGYQGIILRLFFIIVFSSTNMEIPKIPVMEKEYLTISYVFQQNLTQFCMTPYESNSASLTRLSQLWSSQKDLGLLKKPGTDSNISRNDWESLQLLCGNFLRYKERTAWEKFVHRYDQMVSPESLEVTYEEKPVTASEMRAFRQEYSKKQELDEIQIQTALTPFFDAMVTKMTKILQSKYELCPETDTYEISWLPILRDDFEHFMAHHPASPSLFVLTTVAAILVYLSYSQSELKLLEERIRILVQHVIEFVSSNLVWKLNQLGYKAEANGHLIRVSC